LAIHGAMLFALVESSMAPSTHPPDVNDVIPEAEMGVREVMQEIDPGLSHHVNMVDLVDCVHYDIPADWLRQKNDFQRYVPGGFGLDGTWWKQSYGIAHFAKEWQDACGRGDRTAAVAKFKRFVDAAQSFDPRFGEEGGQFQGLARAWQLRNVLHVYHTDMVNAMRKKFAMMEKKQRLVLLLDVTGTLQVNGDPEGRAWVPNANLIAAVKRLQTRKAELPERLREYEPLVYLFTRNDLRPWDWALQAHENDHESDRELVVSRYDILSELHKAGIKVAGVVTSAELLSYFVDKFKQGPTGADLPLGWAYTEHIQPFEQKRYEGAPKTVWRPLYEAAVKWVDDTNARKNAILLTRRDEEQKQIKDHLMGKGTLLLYSMERLARMWPYTNVAAVLVDDSAYHQVPLFRAVVENAVKPRWWWWYDLYNLAGGGAVHSPAGSPLTRARYEENIIKAASQQLSPSAKAIVEKRMEREVQAATKHTLKNETTGLDISDSADASVHVLADSNEVSKSSDQHREQHTLTLDGDRK